MTKTEQEIEKIILPVIEKLGYELYDVEFLKESSEWFLRIYIEKENLDTLVYFKNHGYWTEEFLEAGIDCAVRLGKTEILSVLMDEKYNSFPKKKKTFEL